MYNELSSNTDEVTSSSGYHLVFVEQLDELD